MGRVDKSLNQVGSSALPKAGVYADEVEVQGTPVVLNKRFRKTIAEVNAGATLLPAVTGKSYRLIDAVAIAYGGNAGAVTTVDIKGTQTTAVKLVAFAVAGLTQSAVLRAGATNAAVLADGASFVACDAGEAITLDVTGDDVTTATGIDFILTYVLE